MGKLYTTEDLVNDVTDSVDNNDIYGEFFAIIEYLNDMELDPASKKKLDTYTGWTQELENEHIAYGSLPRRPRFKEERLRTGLNLLSILKKVDFDAFEKISKIQSFAGINDVVEEDSALREKQRQNKYKTLIEAKGGFDKVRRDFCNAIGWPINYIDTIDDLVENFDMEEADEFMSTYFNGLLEEMSKASDVRDFILSDPENANLTAKEVAVKLDIPFNDVSSAMSRLRKSGLLKTDGAKPESKQVATTKTAPEVSKPSGDRASAKKLIPTIDDANSAIRAAGLSLGNLWDDIYLRNDKLQFDIDVDRGPRTDHGGGDDGDDWMSSSEVNRLYKKYKEMNKSHFEKLKKALVEKGFSDVNITDDYGEKGHYTFSVSASAKPMTAKQREAEYKQATKLPPAKVQAAQKKYDEMLKISEKLADEYEYLVSNISRYKSSFLEGERRSKNYNAAKSNAKLEKDARLKRLRKDLATVQKDLDKAEANTRKAKEVLSKVSKSN